MLRRAVLKGLAAGALLRIFPSRAGADELLKIGICIPMTGAGFNAVGRQLSSAIKLMSSNTAMRWQGENLKSSCGTTAA